MFTIEQLESKLKELSVQVEQSAANHHILLGSKMTWEALLADAKKVADVAAVIDPALAPEAARVDEMTPAIEAALDAVGKV